MSGRFSKYILRLFGWEIYNNVSPEIKKAVVVIAPHTSTWDFIIGRLAFNVLQLNVKFLIKKEFFFFPIGFLLKWLGGVPVDRQAGRDTFHFARELFDSHESIFLAITPEGTRKLTNKWKKGFYIVSQRADVPIVLAVLDYKNKRGGMDTLFRPSGNYKSDFMDIQKFYKGAHARHPEKFNLSVPED